MLGPVRMRRLASSGSRRVSLGTNFSSTRVCSKTGCLPSTIWRCVDSSSAGRVCPWSCAVSAKPKRTSSVASESAVDWRSSMCSQIWFLSLVNSSVSSCLERSSAPRTLFSTSLSSGVMKRSAFAMVCLRV